jgi:hypothetical protein
MSDIQFGKYAVLDAVTHRFEKEPEWYWKIRSVSASDEIALQKLLYQRKVVTNGASREEIIPVNMEIVLREIALTFAGTNIPKYREEEGKLVPVMVDGEVVPILREDASPDEVEAVLKKFPKEMVMEIWDAVGDANPTWGPRRD